MRVVRSPARTFVAMQVRSTADLLDDCVHCGFCLPACPTYASWSLEADSPRGRIDLMKGVATGDLALGPAVVRHFDRCLGCMACVTACPSGVRYDLLVESTRADVDRDVPRAPGDRAFREVVFGLFPDPARLRAAAFGLALYERSGLASLVRESGVLRALPPRLQSLARLAPDVEVARLLTALPTFVSARGERRGTVALITGCVQSVFFANVNAATVRVLAAEGFDVVVPRRQGCCGALSLHTGRAAEAERFARTLVDDFGDVGRYDAVLVNAAGCGSTLKQYAELLGDGPAAAFAGKVRDVNEFLAVSGGTAPLRAMPLRVAYHDACHLAHAQRIRSQPREVLRRIPELELVEIPNGDECCGSAGVYNLLEPASAREIGLRKVENVRRAAPQVLASANPGCSLQIASLLAERGEVLTTAHPIEIVDAALAADTAR